jgi:hypothetical protein
MNIIFYLSLKKNYEKIKSNLENIINSYNEINYISSSNKKSNINSNIIFEINDDIMHYKKKINDINLQIKIIYNFLFITCNHNFVEDTIDITPDKSKNIIYCSICECNKI